MAAYIKAGSVIIYLDIVFVWVVGGLGVDVGVGGSGVGLLEREPGGRERTI